MAEPNRLDLKSMSITEDQKAKLKQVFPEVFNEGKIDFDKLRLTLGEEVDTGEERFGMTWPGKNDCFKVIQEPSIGTLKPAKDESVGWDKTENLFVEGDNLEVLKLLQRAYYDKVKMIYIDPPYNTGKEFVYPDKYSESLGTYLAYTGQVDTEGVKFSTNTEAEGRFHSKWMSMMYPRLFLSRNLLKEDGLIFVSIDDNELQNLLPIMNTIFGEENWINTLIWKKRYNAAKEKHLALIHDYVLIYSKNKGLVNDFSVPGDSKYFEKHFQEKDEHFADRGSFGTQPLEAGNSMDDRTNLRFPIMSPDGTEIWPRRQWVWGQNRVEIAQKKGYLKFYKNKEGDWAVRHKHYMKDEQGNTRRVKPFSIFERVFTQHGTKEFEELFPNNGIFPFPKPSRFIEHLMELVNDREAACLDFFSGSCTTAHAVMSLNQKDGGNRKFIMVQLPEPCGEDSEASKAGYRTIADIGKERIRRAIKKIEEEQSGDAKEAEGVLPGMTEKQAELDLGFRVFKLGKSNFNIWEGSLDEDDDISDQLELFIDHIDPDSSDEDILYEILLKSGFELTTKIKELNLADKKIYSIAGNALLICLERKLTKELITEMARLQPARVVCLDAGFADNDQLKTNAVQVMKSHDVEDFRTV